MAQLDHLLKYVRTGTAEGDRAFLGEIFIPPAQFAQLCAIEPGGLRLLVGDKGLGKSALVEWIHKVATQKKLPSLLVRPEDIVNKDLPTSSDIASLKRYYYDLLLRTISAQIGRRLQGFLRGDAARLHIEAKQAGLTEDDFVQKSLSLISAVSLPVTKVNGVQLAKELSGKNSLTTLAGAINKQLLSSGSIFFIFIDDTDQLAAPDQPAHLNRLWGLILAMRKLVGECPAIRPIITLRTGVWSRLTTESQGQRDQTDHVRGYVIPLKVDDALIEGIVRKRLQRAAEDMDRRGVDPYTLFFDQPYMTLPNSDDRRSWDSFVTKSSRNRPRDAIQLIKNMIDCASTRGGSQIGSADAGSAMHVYSKERVDDIANEFSLDCRNIREIINTFFDVPFELGFEVLRSHLRTVPGIGNTTIRGVVMKPEVDEDAITILALLHEAGFINPRFPDTTKPRGFRHQLYRDDASFVSYSNWNGMQAATWEVHPAFRTHLMGIRDAKLARKA
ncbi:hypothetical protein JNX00_07965 [Hydrogenophaga sp. YM1]|uniref:P-loop ATPase, Sll1717 family n=1 Tax=Hydrogenophaga sp. YM1 TaxID=2806262 RepID=UPI001956FA44|nr:hypothetical protein [Hydrogenophaga sp. YM1]QRR35788.1 hypothetical protein JNX00_07965 [Hydrogenophaga sp. YM1]